MRLAQIGMLRLTCALIPAVTLPNVAESTGGTGYVLVHHAARPQFSPITILNPVTYFGRLPSNDVVLASANVSRRHAKLIVTDLGVTVHDLDSHNGIFLNGKKVRSTPVAPGDLLYIGDVCVELRRNEHNPLDGRSPPTAVHRDISDEDDSRARCLAALQRTADLAAGQSGDDTAWLNELVQVMRELVEANVAVYVEVHADGELATPIVLQPDGSRGAAPVIWGVVQKAIDTQQPVFTTELAESALVDVVKATDPRAVIAVPVVVRDAGVAAVVFLARPVAGNVFTELELDAIAAMARVAALRLERALAPAAVEAVVDEAALISAQAKLAAAEELIAAEQREVQVLTARVHQLEGESLKLRQQTDLERQQALKAAGERERDAIARLEASLAEQKKAATKDIAAAQKEAERIKAELEKHKEALRSLDEDRRLRATEAEKQKQRATEAEDALVEARAAAAAAIARVADLEAAVRAAKDAELRLGASLAERTAADDAARDRLSALEAKGAEADALRSALRTSLLPTLVDHVEAVATKSAAATTPPAARQVTALYLALSDFDAFCDRAAADDVKTRLDRFVAAVGARVPANGGRIEQVIGHGHLAVFGADADGVRAAVRCGIEVAAIVDSEGDGAGPCVVGGIHVGTAVGGFFGGDDGVAYVEAGVPLIVARAAIEQCPPGKDGVPRGLVVSEAVRSVVHEDRALRVTRLGQSWIKGAGAPMHLAVIEAETEGAA